MTSDNWIVTTLGAIAIEDHGLVDGPFGSNLPASKYTDNGIPVIRGNNLSLGKTQFKSEDFVFVSEETASSLSRSICKPNDVIFTKKGTIGQTGIIPQQGAFDKYLLSSNQMKLTVDVSKADPFYVYYYVSSPQSREKIIRDASVTGVPKTNVTYLRTFPILLPTLAEQRTISLALRILDDKIELNRQMNKTLEEIGRMIFKHWFVDYEFPNDKGSRYLSSGGKLIDTKLGWIPEKWKLGNLGDILSLEYGEALPKKNRKEGEYPVYSSSGMTGVHNSYTFTAPGVILGRAGCPGRVHISGENFFVIDSAFYVKSDFLFFNYFLLKMLDLNYLNSGSAVPGLNRNTAHNLQIIIPNKEIILEFEKLCNLLFSLIWENEKNLKILSQIRDLLLPNLISGKIRFPKEVK